MNPSPDTHLHDVGHRPAPIVALHSSGAGARQWASWRSNWPPSTEVVALDLIGYGEAPAWPAPQALHLLDEARHVVRAIEALGRPVHLVGHSYGGAVALQVALHGPHRVVGLSLYEPVMFSLLRGHDDAAWEEIVATGHRIAALADTQQPNAAAAVFVDYWSGRGAWASLPPHRQLAVAARMPKVAAEFEALFADDTDPRCYHRLEVPVRLVSGGRSPRPARRIAERLAGLLPEVEAVRLHDLGHMGPVESPARVAAAFGLPPSLLAA